MDAEPEPTIGKPEPVARISLSVPDAATALGVSPGTAWRLVKDGALKSIRLRGRTLVTVEELHRYIATLGNGDETAA